MTPGWRQRRRDPGGRAAGWPLRARFRRSVRRRAIIRDLFEEFGEIRYPRNDASLMHTMVAVLGIRMEFGLNSGLAVTRRGLTPDPDQGRRPVGAKLRLPTGRTELSTSWLGSTGPSFAARCGPTDPPVEPGDDVGGSLERRNRHILTPMGRRPMGARTRTRRDVISVMARLDRAIRIDPETPVDDTSIALADGPVEPCRDEWDIPPNRSFNVRGAAALTDRRAAASRQLRKRADAVLG